jgi:PleD family two-component response regulator
MDAVLFGNRRVPRRHEGLKDSTRDGRNRCGAVRSGQSPLVSGNAGDCELTPAEIEVIMSHTVLIADGSALIRGAIRKVLAEEPTIEIVGEAESFETVIQQARDLQPDVILLDLHMPDDRILDPSYIKANLPDAKSKTYILGISVSSDQDAEISALGHRLGANRVLAKANFYD